MAEWPKTFGVDPSTKETLAFGPNGFTKIPAGEPMIPADLGRELYEALKEHANQDEDISRFAEMYPKGASARVVAALARYEREVSPHASTHASESDSA